MNGLWVDAANVVVGEFGAGLSVILLVPLVVLLVMILVDGVRGVPGCFDRRAVRKKKEYIVLMRRVLRDFNASHRPDVLRDHVA